MISSQVYSLRLIQNDQMQTSHLLDLLLYLVPHITNLLFPSPINFPTSSVLALMIFITRK
uniref:Uncharacterized protein n=1 Tax=Rhizophora mucronata TaxID=61149 RepID=A0A2P2P7V5_RHIMU